MCCRWTRHVLFRAICERDLEGIVAEQVVADLAQLVRPDSVLLDTTMNEAAPLEKIVVHYADGRVLKGHTTDFNAAQPAFTLRPIDCEAHDGSSIRIDLQELKAVFFVRDFAGDPEYAEWKHFVTPRLGTRIAVKFIDGEVMIGAELPFTTDYGIYLFPADRASNNEKVFIVKSPAVTLVEQVPDGE